MTQVKARAARGWFVAGVLRSRSLLAVVLVAVAGCSNTGAPGSTGSDCSQSGACPSGLRCFPDWRCYPKNADPDCDPPCYGTEPHCDKAALRCVACLADPDCGDGTVCDLPTGRCVAGCNSGHPQCATAVERCDLTLGVCRGCTADAECTTAAHPRCDLASGRCVACLAADDTCPAGQSCAGTDGNQACAPGCKSRGDCLAGADAGASTLDCCDHQCLDTAADPLHCGSCAVACGASSCCAGTCTNLGTDVDNCSACGRSCALPNVAAPACAAGHCGNAGCESFFGDCDGNPANGCETNLSYDANHCSSCGRACTAFPHAAAACILTSCGLGPCDVGWGDCNSSPLDGCEINLTNDRAHCGACLTPCGATQSCVNGQCG